MDKYIEYHSVCPFARIGSPHPLPRKRVCVPSHLDPGGSHWLAGDGVGGANSADWPETGSLGGDTHSLAGKGVGGAN